MISMGTFIEPWSLLCVRQCQELTTLLNNAFDGAHKHRAGLIFSTVHRRSCVLQAAVCDETARNGWIA